jgi:peptidoglycan/xylan/chitin deacetylase (PgdA/CDA1 family)
VKIAKKLYRNLYSKCPPSVKGRLTGLVSRLPGKPSVKPCSVPVSERFPDEYKGALIISADFEMAWAWRYARSGTEPVDMGLRERANVPAILQMLDEYHVPVTWATVGHLFLESCTCHDGRAHSELSRIPYFTNKVWQYQSGDWYDHDPCTSVEQDPAWYAPDLIRSIMDAKAGHEIACHTFSHLDCTGANCPPQVMEDEIRECARLARAFGVSLKSMVFPGGTNGNYEVLKKYGFTNVRLNSSYDLFYPEKDASGLWLLPSSSSIDNHGFGWSADKYRHYYARYLDKALSTNNVCHLWFHPSIDTFCLYGILPAVLSEVRKRADQDRLWIATMAGMTDFCEGNARS